MGSWVRFLAKSDNNSGSGVVDGEWGDADGGE